ncbi:MAG: LuxR C-terminal-related transcriptional regulator [Moraxellaceae bacterium]|nr:LuxR C-terminal-related transcriptional regulator [Moraxellaceae bacterium]
MSDSAIAFARTKIQPPRARADLIARTRLEDALGKALAQQRLTLLLAPAGWGKTSALARQIAQWPGDTALAWVTADEDDDLPRFLAALTAALEPLDLPWRVAPTALGTLSEGSRGLGLAADEVVNALAGSSASRGLIVIDDLHRVADTRLFEFLAVLAERLPEQWGMVLSSRTDPPLPLARWRARGELAEFRQTALRFESDDISALLRTQGVDTHQLDEQVGELLRRTEGWAAGLRLMLSVGSTGSLAPSRLHVFDFLADEVLAGMSPALRQFLLRCAVLPELTPARCAHVSAMPDAQALFDQVEREGLFVTPLDATGRTLRLHDLFRDFLEDRLQRDHADEQAALLQRAADGEPDLARAVTWLARAGAWDRAAAELATRGPALVPMGGGPTIERLLGLFPASELQRHPELDMLRGVCAFNAFDFDRSVTAMQRAATGFDAAGLPDAAAAARVFLHTCELSSGRHEAARIGFGKLMAAAHGGPTGALATYYNGWLAYSQHRAQDVAACFGDAVEQLERLDDAVTWQNAYFISMLSSLPGMDAVMQRYLHAAGRIAGDHASLLRVGVLHGHSAVALAAGRFGEAREWLHKADDDLQWLGHPRSILTENLMAHLLVDALHGDHTACTEAAATMRADLRESGRANQRTHGGSTLVPELRGAFILGDADWVRRVAADMERAADPFQWAFCPIERKIAAGMVALLDGRNADAEQLLMPPPGPVEFMPLCSGGHVLMLCVEAQRRQGRLDEAAALLQRWFDAVEDGSPIGGALMVGVDILEAIAASPWSNRLPPARVALLRDLAARARGHEAPAHTPAPSPAATTALPAGLTEREAEVLSLMAEGQSNKHIARVLDLSPFTVKRHVANILDKTNTATRTEAATWWVAQKRG